MKTEYSLLGQRAKVTIELTSPDGNPTVLTFHDIKLDDNEADFTLFEDYPEITGGATLPVRSGITQPKINFNFGGQLLFGPDKTLYRIEHHPERTAVI